MLGKGSASARLTLEAIPILPGALDLASQGVGSTLLPANRATLDWHVDGPSGPLTDLLFDPQTCGGLLATVPPAFVSDMLESLAKAGQGAAVIGQITAPDRPGEGRISLI